MAVCWDKVQKEANFKYFLIVFLFVHSLTTAVQIAFYISFLINIFLKFFVNAEIFLYLYDKIFLAFFRQS